MVGLTLAGHQVPTKPLYPSPSSVRPGRQKENKRLAGQNKDRERSLANYHHEQNRLNLQKLI